MEKEMGKEMEKEKRKKRKKEKEKEKEKEIFLTASPEGSLQSSIM